MHKNKQISFVKVVVLALAISFCFNVAKPTPAKAFLLVSIPVAWATNNYFNLDLGDMTPQGMFVCAVLLPLCILDQKAGSNAVTRQELVDNGYSMEEVNQLEKENTELGLALLERKQKMVIAPTDTAADIAQGVRSVLPSASPLFIDFVINQSLAKQ